ncbi:WD40 repeat domain-containing serine/threonine-protein kinase [Spirillospora sp. NPDC029432]|uniref:WD40 repeat domain-containing serine/threonine-protein kinase n=1 Tax=Spirillospora sp. NPDC029432 TaxID=3154599 RepID=UPI0034525C26
MAPVPLTPGEPARLGDYWLAGRLGAGGQGVVYEAYGPDGTRVAVKALHGDYSLRQRHLLAREVEAVRRVSQFCTARVLAADLESAPPYVVSEYVAGPTLQQAVEEGGAHAPDELYRLAVGIATALTTIHRAGVVHRDLKPANVLLGPDGPRVIDFGIARHEDMSQSATGVKGTPRYMAPEVFRGRDPGPAVDVWAWGATILFAASGHAPFAGDTLPSLMHAVTTTEPDTSAVPERLRPIVAAALAKDPGRRPDAPRLLLDLLGGAPDADLLRQGERAAAAGRTPRAAAPTLGERAEAIFEGLDPAARQAVPQVLLRMVAAGDELVRPAAREEFDDGRTPAEVIDSVLGAFGRAGLLTWDGRHLTLATAALLRAWPRLRDWADAERSGLAEHQELVAGIRLWDGHGRKTGDLFQGTRLDRALSWAVSGRRHLAVNVLEQAFLDAGRAAARRRSTLRTAVSGVLAVLLVLTISAGGLVFQQGRTVADQRDEAEARRLAALAVAMRRNDPRTARRLAVAAAALADTRETRETLVALRYQWESDMFAPPGVSTTHLREPSPDGRVLAVADPAPGDEEAGASVTVWDVGARRRLHAFPVPGPRIRDVAVTDDARTLITWTNDGVAHVWDTATGKERGRLPAGEGLETVFHGIDLNPSGTLLLVNGRETRTAWDLRTLRQVPLGGRREQDGLETLSATADGRTIASVTAKGGVALARTPGAAARLPRLEAELKGRYAGTQKLIADGALLAVVRSGGAGRPAEIVVWDVRADAPFAVLGPAVSNAAVAFSRDGRFLAQGRTMWRLERQGPGMTRALPPVVRYASGSGCSQTRFVGDRTLRCVEPTTGQVASLDVGPFLGARTIQHGGMSLEAAISADASAMAYVQGRQVRFWDVRRQRPAGGALGLPRDILSTGENTGLALSPDGRRLAVRIDPRTITIADARKGTALRTIVLPHLDEDVRLMALSPDGAGLALLVKRGPAQELRFWDLRTFKRIRSVPAAPSTHSRRLLFRADGKAVLADGRSGLVEYPSGRVLARTNDQALGTPLALAPDGRTIAAAEGAEDDQKVLLADGGTLRSNGLVLRGHGRYVRAAAFSPDGRLLATGDAGGTIRLWEVRSGRFYAVALTGHQSEIRALAFSPDGGALQSVADAGTVITHDLSPARNIAAVCESTGGGLTEREWRHHLPSLDHRDTCAPGQ